MKNAFLISLVLNTAPALAAGTSADLFAACNAPPGSQADALCSAYLNGYVWGVLGDEIEREEGTPICMPDNINTVQVRDVIRRFFSAHPEALSIQTGGAVAGILSNTYPCKK